MQARRGWSREDLGCLLIRSPELCRVPLILKLTTLRGVLSGNAPATRDPHPQASDYEGPRWIWGIKTEERRPRLLAVYSHEALLPRPGLSRLAADCECACVSLHTHLCTRVSVCMHTHVGVLYTHVYTCAGCACLCIRVCVLAWECV